MGLVAVRVGTLAVTLALLALAVRERRRLVPWLRDYFLAPTSPATLGLLRVVLLALLWNATRDVAPEWHAALPAELRDPPFGWDLLGDAPFHPELAKRAQELLLVTSAAATLGLFTRVSVPLSALLGVYVFGLSQCFGKVNHGSHARMLAVLALSFAPCGDALSLDALLRRLRGRPAAPPSAAYTLPVRVIWLLVGSTYLFPGLWKLLQSGDLWLTGEQLRYELYRRWGAAPDFRPLFRPDEHPWSLPLLGAGTIVLEIGFIFAMLERRARIIAALGAVGFHLGVAAVMGIRFPPYAPLLVLLEVPERWRAFGAKLSERMLARLPAPSRPFPRRRFGASLVVCGVLLLGQTVAGLTKTSSWPISVYPTFAARKGSIDTRPTSVRIVLQTQDGRAVDLGRALKATGVASGTRMVERLAARVSPRDAESRGCEVVALLRHLGEPVEPGDHVVVLNADWELFPIGEREDFEERTSRRFLVRDHGCLTRLHPSRRPTRASTLERSDLRRPVRDPSER